MDISKLSRRPERFEKSGAGEKFNEIFREYGKTKKGGKGRGKIKETKPPVDTLQPVKPPSPPETTDPTKETKPPTTNTNQSLDELAKMYVEQYQKGTGKELTEEQFNQKKAEVAAFYERFGESGKTRLDQIVFAND